MVDEIFEAAYVFLLGGCETEFNDVLDVKIFVRPAAHETCAPGFEHFGVGIFQPMGLGS